MRNHSRTTKWNLFFHSTSIALAIISGIVLVPLYLHYIPLNQYGAWLATGNILAWLTMVDPGLSAVLMQRTGMAYGRRDLEELNHLVTGGILLSTIISLLLLVSGFIISKFFIGWLHLSSTPDVNVLERAFLLAVVGSTLMVFSYGLTALNQGLQSSLGIGLVFVISTSGSLLITFVLLIQGAGLEALPIGLIVRGAGYAVGNAGYLIWRYVSEHMSYRFSTKGVLALAKLTSYTFLGQSAQALSSNMDAFLLTRYLGSEIVPMFVLTRKAPDLSRMFLERPAMAFMPAVSHLVGAGEADKARLVLLRLIRMILWLMGLVSAGFIVFNRPFVALWVGPTLYAGVTLNSIFVISLIVTVVVKAVSNLCFSMGNIKGNSVMMLIEGVLTVLLMFAGAKYFGMVGVAISPLLAMLVVSVWYYPRTFSRLLTLKRSDVLTILREGASSVVSAAVAVGVVSFWIRSTTWVSFVTDLVAFSVVYALALIVVSQVFRYEIMQLFRIKQIITKTE